MSAPIAYEVHGRQRSGSPILLMCPLGGSMALWGRFRAQLAEEHQVIAFDYRGTGESQPFICATSTRGLALEALTLLDHLRLGRVHVFGSSLGGMAATWLALLAPARVHTLSLASTPARGRELTRAGLRRGLDLAGCFVRARADVEPALVRRTLSPRFIETHPDEVRAVERLVRSHSTPRAVLAVRALAGLRHDVRSELHRVRAPALVLSGADDQLLGTDGSRALADELPRARWHLIEEAGHSVTIEQPRACAQHVSRFLRIL